MIVSSFLESSIPRGQGYLQPHFSPSPPSPIALVYKKVTPGYSLLVRVIALEAPIRAITNFIILNKLYNNYDCAII